MWISPDKKIKKEILTAGEFGFKPTENCLCSIEIKDVNIKNLQSEYLSEKFVTIGQANTALDREIDKCLLSMNSKEISLFTINFPENEICLKLNLCHFESQGLIYEWDASKKISFAQNHKENGIKLFKDNRFQDASFRFSKGLKLILSIPIPVDNPPKIIDGISISEINKFKANLYNNLASCYSKINNYETVIDLCTKVLEIDESNTKALHKRGFAYSGTRAFEKARDDLNKVLLLDSNNQAAKEKLQFINSNLNQQEAEFASIVKKMFVSK